MWWHHDWSTWNWLFMVSSMALFWALFIGAVVWAIRASSSGTTPPADRPGARQVLDERFARGEISEDEYRRARDALAER
jgi:putative membrane protein